MKDLGIGAHGEGRATQRRAGTVTVELAMVLPLLLVLLFGIIEFGWLAQDRAELGQVAREGARIAAVGGTPDRITAAIYANTTTVVDAELVVTYRYRSWDSASGTWGGWSTLGANGDQNTALRGDQIQIVLEYPHKLLVPGFMGPIMGADEDGRVKVSANSVMMRE